MILKKPDRNDAKNDYDLRVSAITPKTAALLKQLNIWDEILKKRVQAFSQMQVFNEAHTIHFDATEIGKTALGWLVENTIIQTCLLDALEKFPIASCLMPAQIESFNKTTAGVEVYLKQHETIKAELLVAADGANSWVRQQLGIDIKSWSYQQTAMVATVETANDHQQTAWQRFLSTGPLAFLPLDTKNICSIVWSCTTDKAESLQRLDDDAFNQVITAESNLPLGSIKLISQRRVFPLMMRHTHQYVQENIALIGDAAHTIHPLAGQGANLGFADVEKLIDIILLARSKKKSIGCLSYLRKYERERKTKVAQMIMLMESFHQLFTHDHTGIAYLRKHGLSLMNRINPIKNKIMSTF